MPTIDGEPVHEMLTLIAWAMQAPADHAVVLGYYHREEWRRYHPECAGYSKLAAEHVHDSELSTMYAEFRPRDALRDPVCDSCLNKIEKPPNSRFRDALNRVGR